MPDYELMNGDCLDLMHKIGDKSIDLILADPPYGTTNCAWDSIIDLDKMWDHLKRIIKQNGVIVLMCAQPFTSVLISSNLKMFKYCWYWEKDKSTGHLNANIQPLRNIEEVAVFYKNQPTYNPQLVDKDKKDIRNSVKSQRGSQPSIYGKSDKEAPRTIPANKGYPKQLLKFKANFEGIHDTPKPVSLMEYFIKTYTGEFEVVLDFCMGSCFLQSS